MSSRNPLSPNLLATPCEFSYIKISDHHSVEKPYYYSGPLPPDQEEPRTNTEFASHGNITAYNIRGHEHEASLDQHGFEFRVVPTKVNISQPVDREEKFGEEYMEEVSAWLKNELQAELVLCYNCRVMIHHSDQELVV